MVKGFPGAVLLTQDSPGHCSEAMPSTCTASHVRQYFRTGKLPPPGTVCPVNRGAFPTKSGVSGAGTAQKVTSNADEEARLAAIVEEISRFGITKVLH